MMKKYIVRENRGEAKVGASLDEIENTILEGDPYEVARFDTPEEADAYLAAHPGKVTREKTFYNFDVLEIEGCFWEEVELDEDGEEVAWGDMEYCEFKEEA